MTSCTDHAPIEHDEFYCPLCEALEDAAELQTRVEQQEDKIGDLETTIAEKGIEDLERAEREAEDAKAEARQWRTRFTALVWAVEARHTRENKTQRLQRIAGEAVKLQREALKETA